MRSFVLLCFLCSTQILFSRQRVMSEQACDLSGKTSVVTDGSSHRERSRDRMWEQEDLHWRRHRGHLFFPLLPKVEEESQRRSLLVLTLPKSGSHLIYSILESISGEITSSERGNTLGLPIHLSEGRDLFFASLLSPSPYEPVGQETLSPILMLRDPRDVLISQLHWTNATESISSPWNQLSVQEKIRFLIEAEGQGSLAMIIEEVCRRLSDPDLFLCRFEDLIGEEGGGDLARQSAAIASLANHIGYQLKEEAIHSIGKKAFNRGGNLRKDQVGSFRRYFNKENQERFRELFGPALEKMGYPLE